jgi:UDP-N-acetylglucosamine 2-epimerase (non-hydrolysing)
VVVQGDTTTVFAAAFYEKIPVVHLEAGLRTDDPYSPYPEEINRRLATQLATLHLAPTATSRANLLAENVDPAAVVVTGNTVIDALLWTSSRELDYGHPALADLDDSGAPVLLVTAHRRESWGGPMRAVGRALARIAKSHPDLRVVSRCTPTRWSTRRCCPPSSTCPMSRSPSTERPEAVEAGTVRLVGTDEDLIAAATNQLLTDPAAYAAMAGAINPYGDGHAARRSVAALACHFGLGPAPAEFTPAPVLRKAG